MSRRILILLFVVASTTWYRGSSKPESQDVVVAELTQTALTNTTYGPPETRQPKMDTDRADELFDQQKWSEARAAYDQTEPSTIDVQRHIAERAITCSLRLHDWDDALRRALDFEKSIDPPQNGFFYSWPRDGAKLTRWRGYIDHLEFTRHLLEIIHRNCQPGASQPFQDRLANERISVNFKLLTKLDPDIAKRERYWGWETGYANIQWWWEGMPSAWDDSDSDNRRYYWREGIPVDRDGKPASWVTPVEYQGDLDRPQKILYLLDEVQRLDPTEHHQESARALLHRADLMRRMYGPSSDPAWGSAVFYYQYAERPSFDQGHSDPSLKQLWELDDNEARGTVGQSLQVITLPASDSPIAIWRRIETSFPNSESAAEAIYQCGLYYQNRRQFTKAVDEYERLIKRYPNDNRVKIARKQIENINHADVLLGSTGVYAAGSSPSLWFACRNTGKVEFTARQVDLKEFLLDREKKGHWSELAYFGYNIFGRWQDDNEDLRKFVGDELKQWSQTVSSTDMVSTNSTQVPLTKAGAYLVEARVPGAKQSSKGLIIVTGAAVIQKALPDKVLLWAVDSSTGKPLPNQKIQMIHQQKPRQWTTSTTDQDGAIYFEPAADGETFFLLVTEQGDIAFSEIEPVGYSQTGSTEHKHFGVTDRPLYRPGSTVNFRVWIRELTDRQFRPAKAGAKVRVKIDGPDYDDTVKAFDLVTDESGSVTGSFRLNDQSHLGQYNVVVESPSQNYSPAACQFRVEEYKKPEFEVSVLPPEKTTRLGEPIKAVIEAKYYTGQPVSGAAVRYRINRRSHLASYEMPTRWDWLYGEGFGDYSYLYPWLGDSTMTMEDDWSWSPSRWGFGGRSQGEQVANGITKLNENGIAEISIDTARFVQNVDHQFTITAEVRDESRRTIEGSGSVLATRQQFFAFAKLDRGWYQTGDQATVEFYTRSANNTAVSTDGTVSLYRITPAGELESQPNFEKEIVNTWSTKTDAEGNVKLNFEVPEEGQYRIKFLANDGWQQPVTSESTFWVHGPKFDGSKHRFGGLEITPDKRTYLVGETAKLLINTAQSNARLLIVDSMDQHRFIDIPGNSNVIEIPITARHVPNFFFEATLVHDGQVFNESCEVYVPPVDDLLIMELRPDQQIYSPGQKGKVQVKVTNAAGDPISGSLALAAYDKSLTYIQQEFGTGPKSLLAARRTEYWSSEVESTLGSRKFEISGRFMCPEFHLEDGSEPKAGAMGGSPPSGGDPGDSAGRAKPRSGRRFIATDPTDVEDLIADLLIEPKIRTDFSDTAVWLPNLELDENGSAVGDITFPESLTTWRIQGTLVTPETKVGDVVCEVKTNKDLLVRLQTPRFFVESDDVVLSANVHNYLPVAKDVSAELIVPAGLFKSTGDNPAQSTPQDDQGNLHLVKRATVQPGKAHRFDWPLKVQSDGLATITVKAQTDVESDAMQMAFPVLSRGIVETESQTGFFLAAETGSKEINFELPANIDPSKTGIELTMAPSAAGAAFDALPFLAGYPYGCVEQTMSRFYPTVLAADTLKKLGTDLEAVAKNMTERDLKNRPRFTRSSVFDSIELRRMSDAGLNRLFRFQHEDGGWGWWEHDDSSPYMTAYVLLGLNTAADSGVKVPESVYQSGVNFLIRALDDPPAEWTASATYKSDRALIAYVLSLKRSYDAAEQRRTNIRSLIDSVHLDLTSLNPYGKALLALALHNRNKSDDAKTVLRGILETVKNDEKLNTSWVPTSQRHWWRWYNSDIETNAWVLRALITIDSDNDLASRLVNWLVGQRRNGNYWRSTRDSALAVHALAEYMLTMQQSASDYSVAVHLDGQHVKDVQVSWKNMLEMESRVFLSGETVTAGKHQLTLVKDDQGPLHFSSTAEYFTKHDRIRAKTAGGLRLNRRYYRLPRTADGEADTAKPAVGGDPARIPLEFGDEVSVGDTIEVQLTISAEEDFEYLAFEDPKPAGCEPIRLRSGYGWGAGLCSNLELRDSKVVFFVHRLRAGEHELRYKLRAEVPGTFSAMPSEGFAMYTPEIHARSDEMQLIIRD